jgi:hypothetical protein
MDLWGWLSRSQGFSGSGAGVVCGGDTGASLEGSWTQVLGRCLYWCVRPITVRYRGLDGLNNKIRFLVIVGAGSPGSRCQEVVSEVPLLAV